LEKDKEETEARRIKEQSSYCAPSYYSDDNSS